MHFQSQLIFKIFLATVLMFWAETVVAKDEEAISNLYNALLRHNHQIEARAPHNGPVRLRFGRRSVDDVNHALEKRWYDIVTDQKPIRSPSLRLRFGRRSDPSMPMHSPLDMIINNELDSQLYESYDDVAADNRMNTEMKRSDNMYDSPMKSENVQSLIDVLKYMIDNEYVGSEGSNSGMEDDKKRSVRQVRISTRLRYGRNADEPMDGGAKNLMEKRSNLADISNTQSLVDVLKDMMDNEYIGSEGSNSGMEDDKKKSKRQVRISTRLRYGRNAEGPMDSGAKNPMEKKSNLADISKE